MSGSLLYIIFFLSGVAGLGYELLWTKMFATSLGHETVAVFAVVAAFFGGLACGAWCLDRYVSSNARPGFVYGVLEGVIGIWGLALLTLMPFTNNLVIGWLGVEPSSVQHWSIAFLYPFVFLFPATFCMGGTLPAMDRLYSRMRSVENVAGLYGVNTLGAVAAIAFITYLLLPFLGLWKVSCILFLCNISCAVGAFSFDRLHTSQPFQAVRPQEVQLAPSRPRFPYLLVLFLTGCAGIGFEVLMVRGLSQIFDNSVYSFASILMVFLLGNGIGAVIFQRFLSNLERSSLVPKLLLATGFFSLVSVSCAGFAENMFQAVAAATDDGLVSIVLSELFVSAMYLMLPTLTMGATFGCLAQMLKNKKGGVGVALSLNTLGGTIAPLVFGVILVPTTGLKGALLCVVLLYVLCGLVLQLFAMRKRSGEFVFSVILVFLTIWTSSRIPSTPFVHYVEDEKVVDHREGVMASVDVIQYPDESLHLRVNNHFQMGGTGSVYSDRRQAYLPLLLHPHPQNVLCLGVGAGITFSSFSSFPDISATGVELVPEVLDVLPSFASVTGDLQTSPNLKLVNADARRYVKATTERFDLVIADLFHPGRDGAGSLYTREHFTSIKSILEQDGLFCQWLPLYQLDIRTLRTIIRTFIEVFPKGQMFLAHYSLEQPIIGLIGSTKELKYPENWFQKRVKGKNFVRQMGIHGYDSIYSLLGTFLAGPGSLEKWTQGVDVNSDVHPIVTYQAPLIFANKGEDAGERLLSLVDSLESRDPEDIFGEVVTEEDYLARERMVSYWQARDLFIRLGENVPKTRDAEKLYKVAGQPLLDVVRKSIDFTSAYFPLVSIAYNLYPVDQKASFSLLRDLERANPLRPEAGLLRRKLFDEEDRSVFTK